MIEVKAVSVLPLQMKHTVVACWNPQTPDIMVEHLLQNDDNPTLSVTTNL